MLGVPWITLLLHITLALGLNVSCWFLLSATSVQGTTSLRSSHRQRGIVFGRRTAARRLPPSSKRLVATRRTSQSSASLGSSTFSDGLALAETVLFDLRGGGGNSDEEDEGESEYDDETDDGDAIEDLSGGGTLVDLSKNLIGLVGKFVVSTIRVTSRVVLAAFEGDGDEAEVENGDDESTGVVSKIFRALHRMWNAAWAARSDDEVKGGKFDNVGAGDESEEGVVEEDEASVPTKKRRLDFGEFLSNSYGVEATRDEIDGAHPILGGSITDALKESRSEARLLVVLIPSSKPGKKSKPFDEDAIKGFLSAEVATVSEKKARAKGGETGSYVLWSAKSGSAEAVAALKRLKATQTNSKGQKRPVLVVAYAAQIKDSSGTPKIAPKLLAQHHCNPPPSCEMMAAWLNALRKRHAKQYAIMQMEVREAQLYRERKAGYKDSVESDTVRQQKEKIEKERQDAIAKAEQERRDAIKQRRKDLKISLPEEPDPSADDVKTIALRFADGRSAQRRFLPDTKIGTIFNWIDGDFEMERETLTVTTLNGKQSYNWEDTGDLTLDQARFGKMVALRVTEKKKEDESKDESGDAGDYKDDSS